MAVTCSMDKSFKIWELVQEAGMEESAWNCRSSGSYKNSPATAAEFATDGSLLAVSFGKVITLWDPLTLTLEKTLYFSLSKLDLKSLNFTKDSLFLVAGSNTHLYVWNMLTCSVWWSLPMRISSISAEHGTTRFAVISGKSDNLQQSKPCSVLTIN